jgi:hypothetical protein
MAFSTRSSRRPAVAAVAIAGLISGACLVTAFLLTRAARDAAVDGDRVIEPAAATAPLRFDEHNFRFAAPPKQWTQVDAKQVNADSILAFVSHQPEMAFIAMAESPGIEQQADLATFRDIVLANHKSLWHSVALRQSRPETRAGIAGERIVVDVIDKQKKLSSVSWLGVHQGYVYQLQVLSGAADIASLNRAGDDMFARFALIDPTRIAHSDNPIEDFHSPRHGYSWRLAGTRWQPWDNLR